MQRRIIASLIAVAAGAAAVFLVPSCGQRKASASGKQVIVLGFDGMDPVLTVQMMDDGRLPNFARLRDEGSFTALGTSTPPQSPVAWSNLMTGTDSGRHGVFDFVHRNPKTCVPFSSAAEEDPVEPLPIVGSGFDEIEAFGYKLPIRPNRIKTNRHARAFWEYLTDAGVNAHVFRMPANYPATPSPGVHYCCLSDMGTPDVTDSLGTFSFYTDDPDQMYRRTRFGGGKIYPVQAVGDVVAAAFHGPKNDFKVSGEKRRAPTSDVPFKVYRDAETPVATVEWADQRVVLHQGEWSDWKPIEFEMVPYLVTLKGMARLYLRQVHPYLELYVSPINFDPLEESWEIDQPDDYSVQVAEAVGRYYTQGLPEDTKALSNKVLNRDEFLQQADIIFRERLKLLGFAMDHYAAHGAGLLFFYFGSTDQVAHMFWGARWPGHPALEPSDHEQYQHVVEETYERMDGVLAKVRDRFPHAVLMVLSDHGFDDFRWNFNINSWLRDNGYARPRSPSDHRAVFNFAFARCRAYALGVNGLYINLRGRESEGTVDPTEKQALMDEIREKLLAYVDPHTGRQPVAEVYQSDRIYHGPMVKVGPDLQIGYARGFRGGSTLGSFPQDVVTDNHDQWCGDHCVATRFVPGIVLANRPIVAAAPTLLDIAPTILDEFDVAVPEEMLGSNLFEPSSVAVAYQE